MFGNGGWNMMQYGYGGMHIFGGLFMALVFVLVLLLVIWLVKSLFFSSGSGSGARAILAQRYARGELTRKEYDQMRKDIGS